MLSVTLKSLGSWPWLRPLFSSMAASSALMKSARDGREAMVATAVKGSVASVTASSASEASSCRKSLSDGQYFKSN